MSASKQGNSRNRCTRCVNTQLYEDVVHVHVVLRAGLQIRGPDLVGVGRGHGAVDFLRGRKISLRGPHKKKGTRTHPLTLQISLISRHYDGDVGRALALQLLHPFLERLEGALLAKG